MKITIRPATPKDYDFLWQLHRATMRPYVEQIWGWDDAEQEQFFKNRRDPNSRSIVEHTGVPIGYLGVDRREHDTYIDLIEIAPAYQCLGLGTKIIRDIIAEGRPVELTVLKVNPARKLYERLGFEVTAEKETHYCMRYDQ